MCECERWIVVGMGLKTPKTGGHAFRFFGISAFWPLARTAAAT